MENNRSLDERMSEIVRQFLEKNFYSKECKRYSNVTDKSLQVLGQDSTFLFNGEAYSCDEKSAVRYRRELRSFSLELSTVNRSGKRFTGWLLNEKAINNSYLFVWIYDSKSDFYNEDGKLIKRLNSPDDIVKAEIALVKKDTLLNHLRSIGWGVDELQEMNNRILNGTCTYMGDIRKDGCKFVYSERLPEKPVNVLLSTDTLVSLSVFHKFYNL